MELDEVIRRKKELEADSQVVKELSSQEVK